MPSFHSLYTSATVRALNKAYCGGGVGGRRVLVAVRVDPDRGAAAATEGGVDSEGRGGCSASNNEVVA